MDGLMVLKRVDNDVAALAPNFVGVNPTSTIKCWSKVKNVAKDTDCGTIQ